MALLTNAQVLARLQLTATSIDTLQNAVLEQLRPASERLVKEYVGYEIEQGTFTEYHPSKSSLIEGDPLTVGYEGSALGAVPINLGDDTTRMLYLNQVPIRSITSLHENVNAWQTAGGSWPSTAQLTEGPDFYVDWDENVGGTDLSMSGLIVRQSGAWTRERRAVRVIYSGGFTASELDLSTGRYGFFTNAALLTVQANFLEAISNTVNSDTGGAGTAVTAESLDGWSVKYQEGIAMALYGMQYTLPANARSILQKHIRTGQFLGI